MLTLLKKVTNWTLSSMRWNGRTPQEALDQISDVTRVIMEWPEAESFSAKEALRRFPQLQDSREKLISLVVHEFAERANFIDVDQFVLQFPEELRSELKDAILVDRGMTVLSGLMTGLNGGSDGALSHLTRKIQWPETGEIFAGFRLEEPLGRGGFSRVFVARELGFEERLVALKICRIDTHEPSVLASLHHAGIGTVHSVTKVPERGLIAICMPLLSRTTLLDVRSHVWSRMRCPSTAGRVWDCVQKTNRLNRRPPFWAESSYCDWVLDVAISLARALSVSHEKGIVHCDIKPSNILVGEDGQPILFDFNIAFRELAANRPGNVGGTVPYMASEQIEAFYGRGVGGVGPGSDLFSLGATIYEMLTGVAPYGTSRFEKPGIDRLLELRQTPPVKIQRLNHNVPTGLAELVHSCLKCTYADRPTSASDLASRLEQIKKRQLRRAVSFRRAAAGLSGSVAATAVAAGIFISQAPDNRISSSGRPLMSEAGITPLSSEPDPVYLTQRQIEQRMDKGYVLLDDDKPEEALAAFLDVLQFNESHFGASIGAFRSVLRMREAPTGDVRIIPRSFDPRSIPELEALCGTILGGGLTRDFVQAEFHLKKVIDGGMADAATLNNYAFCLFSQGRFDEAIEIVDELLADENCPDTARLLRARIRHSTFDQFNNRGESLESPLQLEARLQELYSDDLMNTCRPSALRSFIQAKIEHLCCVSFGILVEYRVEPLSMDEEELWLKHSRATVSAYEDAVEQGMHPATWKLICHKLHPSIVDTQEYRERHRKYVKDVHSYPVGDYRRGFLMDPLVGTSYERWKGDQPAPRRDLIQSVENRTVDAPTRTVAKAR